MNIKPNPEFINSVPAEARKKWHDALVTCEMPQGRGTMVDSKGGWCCLMVGHVSFGGTDEQRDDCTPTRHSPFTQAMCGKESPTIALKNNQTLSAWAVNDVHRLTFPQIARLVYPEAYKGEAA